jgi:hypothetical protein
LRNFGSNGSIRCHCLWVRNGFGSRLIGYPSPMTLSHKSLLSATLISGL